MPTLDWSQCPAVESIPGKVSGAWVFRDTRLPVATVIENLEDLSVEEVMEQFDVTREQIAAVLDFVARSLNASAPEQHPIPVDAHSLRPRNAQGPRHRPSRPHGHHGPIQRLGQAHQRCVAKCRRRSGTRSLANDRQKNSLMDRAGHSRSKHETINHSAGIYVDGDITTNGIESAFSLLKRGISERGIRYLRSILRPIWMK
jgi:uncharacterized protein (DUF433 family)